MGSPVTRIPKARLLPWGRAPVVPRSTALLEEDPNVPQAEAVEAKLVHGVLPFSEKTAFGQKEPWFLKKCN